MLTQNILVNGTLVLPEGVTYPFSRFLTKEQVQEYQQRIRTNYKDNPNALRSLDVLGFDDETQEPSGSNPFVLHELASMGITPASIKTLETLVKTNPDALRNHYEDYLALVIRSERDSYEERNNPLITDLLEQAKKRGETKLPLLVSGILKQVEADNGYGLSSKLVDETKPFHAPGLAYENRGKRFSRLDERNIPIFLSNEEINQLNEEDKKNLRTFYARKDGLSGLFLDGFFDLFSYWGDLDGSGSGGRIVTESAVGAQENFKRFPSL